MSMRHSRVLSINIRFVLLLVLVTFVVSDPMCGGVFSQYESAWRVEEIEIPASVINSIPTDGFSVESITLQIGSDATYTTMELRSGDIEGGILLLEGRDLQKVLFVEAESPDPSVAYIASGKNIMAQAWSDAQSISMAIGVIEPESLLLSDLEGNWRSHFIETPSRIDNGFLSLPFDTEVEAFAISESGQLSGDISGSVSIQDGKRIGFGEGLEVEILYANREKDIAIETSRFEDSLSLAVIVKSPDSLEISELAGHWTLLSISVPNVPNFVGPFANVGSFEVNISEIAIDDQGVVTGPGEEDPGIISINQINTITYVDSDDVIDYSVNASKDYVVTSYLDEDEIVFELGVRRGLLPDRQPNRLRLRPLSENSALLQWESHGNLEILESTDLARWGLAPFSAANVTEAEISYPIESVFYQAVE